MTFPKAKDLKKLAEICRKAGIKSFKNAELEFTLSEEAPISNYKKRLKNNSPAIDTSSNSDTSVEVEDLTEDQLLFWSSGIEQQSVEDQ